MPKRVVWKQAGVTKAGFYWLAAPKGHVKAGTKVIAERDGQVIRILEVRGTEKLTVLLDDRMLDLDKEVTISRDGEVLFRGRVERKLETLSRTLNERLDPRLSFSAEVPVDLSGLLQADYPAVHERNADLAVGGGDTVEHWAAVQLDLPGLCAVLCADKADESALIPGVGRLDLVGVVKCEHSVALFGHVREAGEHDPVGCLDHCAGDHVDLL